MALLSCLTLITALLGVSRAIHCFKCSTASNTGSEYCTDAQMEVAQKQAFAGLIQHVNHYVDGCGCCTKFVMDFIIYRGCSTVCGRLAMPYYTCLTDFCNSAPPITRHSSFVSAHLALICVVSSPVLLTNFML